MTPANVSLSPFLGNVLPQGDVSDLKVLHVVWTVHVVMNHTLSRTAEGLNRKELTLLKSKRSKSVLSSNSQKQNNSEWEGGR